MLISSCNVAFAMSSSYHRADQRTEAEERLPQFGRSNQEISHVTSLDRLRRVLSRIITRTNRYGGLWFDEQTGVRSARKEEGYPVNQSPNSVRVLSAQSVINILLIRECFESELREFTAAVSSVYLVTGPMGKAN